MGKIMKLRASVAFMAALGLATGAEATSPPNNFTPEVIILPTLAQAQADQCGHHVAAGAAIPGDMLQNNYASIFAFRTQESYDGFKKTGARLSVTPETFSFYASKQSVNFSLCQALKFATDTARPALVFKPSDGRNPTAPDVALPQP